MVDLVAPPFDEGQQPRLRAVPGLKEHSEQIRRSFSVGASGAGHRVRLARL
ncbi:MAG: hypothetical protein R3E50_09830 [Halioglobus sp.]